MIGKPGAFSHVAGAYAASQKLTSAAPAGQPAGAGSFAEMLGRVVGGAAESGRRADGLATAAALGQRTEFAEMVTAVTESEVALETLVAVRDKIIQAYDEIIRMPI